MGTKLTSEINLNNRYYPREEKMEENARYAACTVLYEVDKNNAYSNIKINEYFSKHSLSPLNRAFTTDIIYGTLRWKIKIDYLIQRNIFGKLEELKPWTLICLRVAIYQFYFMDKVPDFAAVNEAVEIVRVNEPETAALVNGVLRNILRNKDQFYKITVKNKIKRISIEYSHPEWLVKKFVKVFGEEFVIELMKTNNSVAGLTARVNSLKITRENLIKILIEQGYEVHEGALSEAITIKGYAKLEKSEEFKNGYFIFQDESSMLSSKVLNPIPGSKVIDLCSAPGGKATHLGEIMKNNGEILAFDIYNHKLDLINSNANKLGIDIIKTQLNDATLLNEGLVGYGDFVLVDAPCSGIGLFRKKPEIKWNLKEEHIEALAKLQRDILQNAVQYVKPGGVMVYSTCTLTIEENEEIINWFLEKYSDFRLESIEEYLPDSLRNQGGDRGYIKLFPNINNCDGFFIARIRKEG